MTTKPASSVPLATKVGLVSTVAVTATAVVVFTANGAHTATECAPYLVLFTGLFLLRVAGQVLVRTRHPSWLPPTEQWNLVPYAVLLPAQLAILALMTWIDADFTLGSGFWVQGRTATGERLIWFSLIYAAVMVVRYVVRMIRRPESRWFGGAIPIVFHWVLAAYLFVLGSFYAGH